MGDKWAPWIVALVALAAGTGCGEAQHIDPAASEKVYQLGAQLFQQGQYRPALEELLRATKLNPQNADALYLLGIIALREASDGEEMMSGETCLQAQDAALMKDEIESNFRKAEERFKQVLVIKPEFSEAWNGLAVVQLHFQRWSEVIATELKALGSPTYATPWMAQGNLGWAYLNRKELPLAAKELRESVFANPRFCVGRYRLGKVYYEEKNFEGAAEELEKVSSDPKCAIQEAQHLLGLVSLKRGDRARAESAFKACVDLHPKSCLARECRIAAP